jgi:hypothetical protein
MASERLFVTSPKWSWMKYSPLHHMKGLSPLIAWGQRIKFEKSVKAQ